MEFIFNNYLVNYLANSNDFKIIIYNTINNKKYEIVKTEDDYKIYKDIGIDIFEVIKYCFEKKNFLIEDNNDYLSLKLNSEKIDSLTLICYNIRIDKKEIGLLELKNELENFRKKNNMQESLINKLVDMPFKIINNDTFNKNIREIHITKEFFSKKYIYNNLMEINNIKINVLSKCITTNLMDTFMQFLKTQLNFFDKYEGYYGICYSSYSNLPYPIGSMLNIDYKNKPIVAKIINKPKFENLKKYPEIPKLYFSDDLKITELVDNLRELQVIGFSDYTIKTSDIMALKTLTNITKIIFFNCNFLDITQEKITSIMDKITVIFDKP